MINRFQQYQSQSRTVSSGPSQSNSSGRGGRNNQNQQSQNQNQGRGSHSNSSNQSFQQRQPQFQRQTQPQPHPQRFQPSKPITTSRFSSNVTNPNVMSNRSNSAGRVTFQDTTNNVNSSNRGSTNRMEISRQPQQRQQQQQFGLNRQNNQSSNPFTNNSSNSNRSSNNPFNQQSQSFQQSQQPLQQSNPFLRNQPRNSSSFSTNPTTHTLNTVTTWSRFQPMQPTSSGFQPSNQNSSQSTILSSSSSPSQTNPFLQALHAQNQGSIGMGFGSPSRFPSSSQNPFGSGLSNNNNNYNMNGSDNMGSLRLGTQLAGTVNQDFSKFSAQTRDLDLDGPHDSSNSHDDNLSTAGPITGPTTTDTIPSDGKVTNNGSESSEIVPMKRKENKYPSFDFPEEFTDLAPMPKWSEKFELGLIPLNPYA